MDRRLAFPLVVAAGLVYACGPHPRATSARTADAAAPTAAGGAQAVPARRAAHRAAPDTSAIGATLRVEHAGPEVRFALTLVNGADHRVEIRFPDGRTREFTVYDEIGREVWRWSAGRLFTQMIQNRLLGAGDSTTIAERWTPSAPGRYRVVAVLRSSDHPLTRSAEFVVAGSASAASAASAAPAAIAAAPIAAAPVAAAPVASAPALD